MFKFFIALLIFGCASAWADDNDSNAFPNRLKTTPPPEAPKARLTTVPQQQENHQGQSGRLSPEGGSAMGLGVAIPLGKPKKQGKPKPVQTDEDEQQQDQ